MATNPGTEAADNADSIKDQRLRMSAMQPLWENDLEDVNLISEGSLGFWALVSSLVNLAFVLVIYVFR
jgi:hypothetical protein